MPLAPFEAGAIDMAKITPWLVGSIAVIGAVSATVVVTRGRAVRGWIRGLIDSRLGIIQGPPLGRSGSSTLGAPREPRYPCTITTR